MNSKKGKKKESGMRWDGWKDHDRRYFFSAVGLTGFGMN